MLCKISTGRARPQHSSCFEAFLQTDKEILALAERKKSVAEMCAERLQFNQPSHAVLNPPNSGSSLLAPPVSGTRVGMFPLKNVNMLQVSVILHGNPMLGCRFIAAHFCPRLQGD